MTLVFDRNLGEGVEAEDLALLPMADGSFFHCSEVGSAKVNMRFSHYAKP